MSKDELIAQMLKVESLRQELKDEEFKLRRAVVAYGVEQGVYGYTPQMLENELRREGRLT